MGTERDIKFRAWDSDGYIMHPGFTIQQIGVIMAQPEPAGIHAIAYKFCFHQLVFQQFTGLKDKNGVEIYEGDVVKCHDHPTGVDSATGEVFYAHGSWKVKDTVCPLADFGTAWTEVIGNIYENPELVTSPV